MKKLIHNIKFNHYKNALYELSDTFTKETKLDLSLYDYWVPIPYHSSKLKERGYDVVSILFDNLMKKNKIKKLNLLIRQKNTKPLYQLSAKERKIKISESFVLNENIYLKQSSNILIADDIVTTKSTMKEAIKTLKKHSYIKKTGCISLIKS